MSVALCNYMELNVNQNPVGRFRLSTEAFAARYLVAPQSVRKQHSAKGAYCGVRPLVLPNRRLLWPDDSIEQLAKVKFGDAA